MKKLIILLVLLTGSASMKAQILSEKSLKAIKDTSVDFNIIDCGFVDSSGLFMLAQITPHNEKLATYDTMFISHLTDDLAYNTKMRFEYPSTGFAPLNTKYGKKSNGDYYITGYPLTPLSDFVEYTYIEYDSNGNMVLDSTSQNNDAVTVTGACAVDDNFYYKSGYFNDPSNKRMFISRSTCLGKIEWTKEYSVCADTESIYSSLYKGHNGDIWCRIVISNQSGETVAVKMMKIDKDGNLLWIKPCGENTVDFTFDNSGNMYCISDYTKNNNEITKYDSDFNKLISKRITGNYSMFDFKCLSVESDRLIVGGRIKETSAYVFKLVLLETDLNLNTIRQNISSGEYDGNPICKKIISDKYNSAYAFYIIKEAETGNPKDYMLIKLADNTNDVLSTINEIVPVVSPTPFRSEFTLKCDFDLSGSANVKIYNTLGNIVSENDYILNAEGKELKVNAGDLAPGTYFVEIRSDKGVFRTKTVKAE